MFILNWDFDVLPITFDENFMLYSLFTYALFFIHVSYILLYTRYLCSGACSCILFCWGMLLLCSIRINI